MAFATPPPPEAEPEQTPSGLRTHFIKQLSALTPNHKIQDIYAFLGYPDAAPNIVKMEPAELVEMIETLKRFPPEAP